ncbi:MAG TPA: hypothetical protein VI320_27420 [Terracidiphilus sp.]|jgi:hypothetical protein
MTDQQKGVCTQIVAAEELLLWHAQSGHRLAPQSAIERPWYTRKTSVSFEDILRNLRQATWQEKIFGDPRLNPRFGS